MAFAVELYLDADTEGLVRGLWKGMAEAGISDSMLGEGFYPHITLGIANQLDSSGLWPALSTLARGACPLSLNFAHIGVFPNAEAVVYLGATVTRPLLEFHEAFQQIFSPFAQEPWAYYQTGSWVPHCTVSFGLTRAGVLQAVELCLRQVRLPLQAQVAGIGVAEVLPNRARTIFMHRMDQADDD